MSFSIITAWKDLGDPHRLTSFEFTRRYWAHHFPEAELVVGTPEPFTRARGLNMAARSAANDVLLLCDPDSILPRAQVEKAVAIAEHWDGLVIPFDEYLYLDEQATEWLHTKADLDELPEFFEEECQQHGYGGCGPAMAFSKRTFETVGGFDERFGIWGGDDSAFAYACGALYDPPSRRITGPVLHSYHPRLPQSEPHTRGYAEQFALLAQWRDASESGPDAVKALMASLA